MSTPPLQPAHNAPTPPTPTTPQPHITYDGNPMHWDMNIAGQPKSAEVVATAKRPNTETYSDTVLENLPDKICTKICVTARVCTPQKNGNTTPISAPNRQFVMLPGPTSNLAQAWRVLQQLLRIKWPVGAHQSHVARLTKFTQLWYRLTRGSGNCTVGNNISGFAYFLFVFPVGYAGEPTYGSFVNNWHGRYDTIGHAGWFGLNRTVREECEHIASLC